MASDLYSGTDLVVENHENAIWSLEKGTFPVTLYDRPGLALSNLLLRGNVDAATRAIFSPQTLTPSEMKTFSDRLVGDNKNKVLRVLADIVTNPLVLLGVVMAFKYPIGKSNVLFEIGKGMRGGKPGPLLSKFMGAFSNLKNVPYANDTLAEMGKASGNMAIEFTRGFDDIVNTYIKVAGKGVTKADWLKSHAYISGFHKIPEYVVTGQKVVKGKIVPEMIPLRGTRKAAHSVYKVLDKKTSVWPGLEQEMSPELRKMSDKISKLYTDFHKKFTGSKAEWAAAKKEIEGEMAAKGFGNITLGDFQGHYQPIYARFSPLEGIAAKNILSTGKHHTLLAKARAGVAGATRPAMGVTIGNITELRQMEKMGMPPLVDKLLGAIQKDTDRMATFLHETLVMVQKKGGTPLERANEFATEFMTRATKNKMNTRLRLGTGNSANEALRQVYYQLESASIKQKGLGDKINGIASVLATPAQYGMNPVKAIRRYATQMSSTWAYHIAPIDKSLGEAVKKYFPSAIDVEGKISLGGYKKLIEPIIKSVEGQGFQGNYMGDWLLPMLRGLKPHNAYARATMMGQYKDQMGLWLSTHPVAKRIPESSLNYLKNYFSDFSQLSSESVGAKISEFFYVSTLGLNIAPASKNLLQNYLTTLHIPGINKSGLYGGVEEMTKDIGKYLGHLKGGMSRDVAWKKAFPDYVKTTGEAAGMTHAMKAGDIAKEGIIGKVAGAGIWEKTKDVMLTPFATSEAFNRLFGFYVGKHSYLANHGGIEVASAVVKGKAMEFGGMVNQMAHFPGGPLGMPRYLLGKWGPLRQFMHFPMRYAGFLGGSLEWGTGIGKYRTLATSAGASAGLYTAAKGMLGIDLSQGLMTGALPMPQYEKSPFYPWPLVPPIAAVAGEGAKALATGEAGGLARTASLLAPGGVALRRLYKTLGPKTAAYNRRTPDGRVPVYNDQHALIGAFTPWQMFMKSVGLAPIDQQAEYGAAKWLLTQREKIRSYRRDYLEAMADNDIRKADTINRQFQKAYPEMGPLQVKKSDIKAIHNRREVSRLQRILKGFPKAYQGLFGHMVSQSGLAEMTSQLESSPTAIDQFTPLMTQ